MFLDHFAKDLELLQPVFDKVHANPLALEAVTLDELLAMPARRAVRIEPAETLRSDG